MAANAIQTADGTLLALERWEAENPKAILLALHGMNDYAEAFREAATFWAEAGLTVLAFDQRGFGRSPRRGEWVGSATLEFDAHAAIDAIRARWPEHKIFLLGHSMGGAVALVAASGERPLDIDGLILAAPALLGGDNLSWPLRAGLNVAATFAPGATATGESAGRQASDNLEALRALSRDPLVIKRTRLDATLGLVRLMGEAVKAPPQVCEDALFLIGARDEIIRPDFMRDAAAQYCGRADVIEYSEGWHLLLRDLQRETVWRDIETWIDQRLAD